MVSPSKEVLPAATPAATNSVGFMPIPDKFTCPGVINVNIH